MMQKTFVALSPSYEFLNSSNNKDGFFDIENSEKYFPNSPCFSNNIHDVFGFIDNVCYKNDDDTKNSEKVLNEFYSRVRELNLKWVSEVTELLLKKNINSSIKKNTDTYIYSEKTEQNILSNTKNTKSLGFMISNKNKIKQVFDYENVDSNIPNNNKNSVTQSKNIINCFMLPELAKGIHKNDKIHFNQKNYMPPFDILHTDQMRSSMPISKLDYYYQSNSEYKDIAFQKSQEHLHLEQNKSYTLKHNNSTEYFQNTFRDHFCNTLVAPDAMMQSNQYLHEYPLNVSCSDFIEDKKCSENSYLTSQNTNHITKRQQMEEFLLNYKKNSNYNRSDLSQLYNDVGTTIFNINCYGKKEYLINSYKKNLIDANELINLIQNIRISKNKIIHNSHKYILSRYLIPNISKFLSTSALGNNQNKQKIFENAGQNNPENINYNKEDFECMYKDPIYVGFIEKAELSLEIFYFNVLLYINSLINFKD
ncbi:hypothetical protein BB561_006401 [Smittium simulii]|uniref:Uncharacterized protein n=1 Tax=Smittium simulii TaxID=133385 RepID=A0A2T9Y4K0_9FUNG|nr:hypothetical protein BB561_006401 [Smittium simulii]